MRSTTTSAKAFKEAKREGMLSRQQLEILECVRHNRDYSRTEISVLSRIPINCVSARVNELVKSGALIVGETRPCGITGRTVHAVKVPADAGAAGLRIANEFD